LISFNSPQWQADTTIALTSMRSDRAAAGFMRSSGGSLTDG
jgi:hypothetical protein